MGKMGQNSPAKKGTTDALQLSVEPMTGSPPQAHMGHIHGCGVLSQVITSGREGARHCEPLHSSPAAAPQHCLLVVVLLSVRASVATMHTTVLEDLQTGRTHGGHVTVHQLAQPASPSSNRDRNVPKHKPACTQLAATATPAHALPHSPDDTNTAPTQTPTCRSQLLPPMLCPCVNTEDSRSTQTQAAIVAVLTAPLAHRIGVGRPATTCVPCRHAPPTNPVVPQATLLAAHTPGSSIVSTTQGRPRHADTVRANSACWAVRNACTASAHVPPNCSTL